MLFEAVVPSITQAEQLLNKQQLDGAADQKLHTEARNPAEGKVSARWPGERALTEKMDVQMRHGFSTVAAVVDDEPVAGLGDAEFFGEHRGR